jgi:superfamily II DNA or RNA helicase
MELAKYKTKYIDIINDYIENKDPYQDYFIYEVLYALKLDLILWSDIPPNFAKLYNIPHALDYGIDLVNLDFNQTCQVKHYCKNSTIKWKDFCTFATYSKLIINTDDMIIATTPEAKIDKLVNAVIENKNIKLIRHKFDNLMKITPKYKEEPKKETTLKIEKRQYLIDCYNVVNNSDKQSLKLQLPCGTGKTYIMLYIIRKTLKREPDSNFVIFCPWIDLAKQTFELFDDFGINVFLIGDGNKVYDNDFNVIVCVNPSNKYIENESFKYKFIDEAHHLESESSKIKNQINDIESEKDIFLSATFHDNDDLDYDYPMDQAIEDGYISDYVINVEYFSEGDKMKSLVKLVKDNMQWCPLFIYFNNTERCITFKELLNDDRSEYLIGTDDATKRNKIKNGINDGSVKVLCLCGVYNEGISFNNLQTVIFGDLRHSPINKIQIAMRANRLHDNKPYYRVVLPINEHDFKDKDIKDLIGTFCRVDSRVKESVNKRDSTRIKINIHGCADGDAEFLYEEIYDRFGNMIDGLSFDEKVELLFKYADDYEGAPKQKYTESFGMGKWFCKQKNKIYTNEDKLYEILSKNKWIKISLDENLKYKEENKDKIKLTRNEKLLMLIEYVKDIGEVPKSDGSIYHSKVYGDYTIGVWFRNQKSKYLKKEGDDTYNELNKHCIIEESMLECLKKRKKNAEKEDDIVMMQLLFNYVNNNTKHTVPPRKLMYDNGNGKMVELGEWYRNKRESVKSESSQFYTNTEHNEFIKKSLDKSFNRKKSYEKIKILNFDQYVTLLFEYVDANKYIAPADNVKYKGFPIRQQLRGHFRKIKSPNESDPVYKALSKRECIKKLVDDYCKRNKIV